MTRSVEALRLVASNVSQLERSVFEMLQGPDGTIRRAAVEVLGWIEGIVADAGIRDIGLNDPDIATRWAAQRSVTKRVTERRVRQLMHEFQQAAGSSRWSLLLGIIELEDPQVLGDHRDSLWLGHLLPGWASRARRTAAGSARATRSSTKTRLPSDLDIFVPSRPTRPTWSQWRTKGARSPPRSGRPRTRGGGRRGRARRRARRRSGRGRAAPAPSTRRASRDARAPARLPGRLVLERGLPQHEVEGVALARVVGAAPVLGEGQHHSRGSWLTWPKRGNFATSK